MTRKKSKTKRVAPKPPKQRIVKRKTRQITLPQEVIELAEMTHFSIPRKIDLNKAPPPTIYVTPTANKPPSVTHA